MLRRAAHVGITLGEKAVCARRAGIVLNGQEQLRRRIVEPMCDEVGLTQRK